MLYPEAAPALRRRSAERGAAMLWGITVVLLLLWLLGFTAFHTVGAWIHILLVLAVVSVTINLIRGHRTVL
jgi:hypothetical protein